LELDNAGDRIKGGKNMKCGLVIGHKANRPGACNKTHGICEYQFNDQLACDIYDYMKEKESNINIRIIHRRTYKGLPKRLVLEIVEYYRAQQKIEVEHF
jgi:hypothetical protein